MCPHALCFSPVTVTPVGARKSTPWDASTAHLPVRHPISYRKSSRGKSSVPFPQHRTFLSASRAGPKHPSRHSARSGPSLCLSWQPPQQGFMASMKARCVRMPLCVGGGGGGGGGAGENGRKRGGGGGGGGGEARVQGTGRGGEGVIAERHRQNKAEVQ